MNAREAAEVALGFALIAAPWLVILAVVGLAGGWWA